MDETEKILYADMPGKNWIFSDNTERLETIPEIQESMITELLKLNFKIRRLTKTSVEKVLREALLQSGVSDEIADKVVDRFMTRYPDGTKALRILFIGTCKSAWKSLKKLWKNKRSE